MAIRVLEYHRLPGGSTPVRPGGHSAQTAGTVGASSVQSSAFADDTNFVIIQSDEACHVVFGDNPTAATNGFKIAAGETHDFAVAPGSKVAWIQE